MPALINLDFADVQTVMTNGGIAHIGIGENKGDDKAMEAVQQAVESPLLETSIKGAANVIINIRGDISLMDANDAASYVQEIVGEEANIIFGAMYDDTDVDTCKITVIATGLNDAGTQPVQMQPQMQQIPQPQPVPTQQAAPQPAPMFYQQPAQTSAPVFPQPPVWNRELFTAQPAPRAEQASLNLQQPNVSGNVQTKDIQIPEFLKNRNK